MKSEIVLLLIILASSCAGESYIEGARVNYVQPKTEIVLEQGSGVSCELADFVNVYDLQVVSDSVLVLYGQGIGADAPHFMAYSTMTLECLGGFIYKGRGPGEMISPRIVNVSADESYLYLKDASVPGKSYAIDVLASISQENTSIVRTFDYSDNTLEWVPLSQSTYLFMCRTDKHFVYDISGDEDASFKVNDCVREDDAFYLSNIIVSSIKRNMAAVVMCMLPQIDLIDAHNQKLSSVATNRNYKNWKSIIETGRVKGPQALMNENQYYLSATSTEDYIFALYKDAPISELGNSEIDTFVQIFDWSGNYIIKLQLKDSILDIAYAPDGQYLYCLTADNGIIRYDLTKYLYQS